MNREKAAELWPIVKGYAEGAEIEVRGSALHSWEPVLEPMFYAHLEYRIKPKPREVWTNFYAHVPHYSYSTELEARERGKGDAVAVAVHMKEVLE